MGGWIVQVSNPACPKDTTRICRRQGRGNPPPTLIERRGNPPLVAKTRCDQILLFSACQKDGCNAQFAILNKKGAPMPQYWDLQLQHRCALKRLKKVRTHYGSPQKEVLLARGSAFAPDLRFCFYLLYQHYCVIATAFFGLFSCATACAIISRFPCIQMYILCTFIVSFAPLKQLQE